MCTAALALASLEVAIRRAGASLLRLEDIGVHAQAHAATGLAPFKAGLGEDAMQPQRFRLAFDLLRTRHHHRLDVACDLAALDDPGRGLKVKQTGVGARADKD